MSTDQLTKRTAEIRQLHQSAKATLALVNKIERNLFAQVRPGYALFFLAASCKRPVSLDEVRAALVRGSVITSLDDAQLMKAAYRLVAYHVRAGRLRWTNKDRNCFTNVVSR